MVIYSHTHYKTAVATVAGMNFLYHMAENSKNQDQKPNSVLVCAENKDNFIQEQKGRMHFF